MRVAKKQLAYCRSAIRILQVILSHSFDFLSQCFLPHPEGAVEPILYNILQTKTCLRRVALFSCLIKQYDIILYQHHCNRENCYNLDEYSECFFWKEFH